MKNLVKGISILLLLVCTIQVSAQKSSTFLGTVKYKMTVEGSMSEAEKAQIEGTLTTVYGDGVQKTEMARMMGSFTTIEYPDSGIVLQEGMGQKIAIRMNREEFDLFMEQISGKDTSTVEPVVQLYDETKIVAGKKCKKAEIETGDQIIEVYYFPEYQIPESMQDDDFKEIKGLPLEYTVPIGEEGTMKFSAFEIKKKKKVKAKEFAIPADFKIMTWEEINAQMGG